MSEKPSPSSEQSQWRAPDSPADPPRRRPGGAAEAQLWQPQVIASNGQLTEQGVRIPDGQFVPFKAGERFVLIREREGDTRKPMIILPDGQEVSFQAWQTMQTESNNQGIDAANFRPAIERNRTGEPLPDVAKLKAVSERCTQTYEGKYSSALFGNNFEIAPDELSELNSLVTQADRILSQFKAELPLWPEFIQILEERRRKVGFLAEKSSIVQDELATDITKELIDGQLPALRVPSQIKHLYIWDNLKERVQYDIDDYRLGRANGRSATQFGRNIKQLYRFLKESTI